MAVQKQKSKRRRFAFARIADFRGILIRGDNMSLISEDLTGCKIDKVKQSIERLKTFEPDDGYFLAFSGGKDSVVIKALADMAGVKYTAHYHITTVDPPELTHFIRDRHNDVVLDRPKYSMRQLIIKHLSPPTRWQRYCCKYLKETNGKGSVTVTGTRWAESLRRKESHGVVTIENAQKQIEKADESQAQYKITRQNAIIMNLDNDSSRRTVELCYRTNKTLVNPIIDWDDDDIWEFIHSYNIPYCKLYDEGIKRLGCVGCPLADDNKRRRDFVRWPLFYKVYLRAFEDMLRARDAKGKEHVWNDADDVMDWWLGNYRQKQIDGQQSMFE